MVKALLQEAYQMINYIRYKIPLVYNKCLLSAYNNKLNDKLKMDRLFGRELSNFL